MANKTQNAVYKSAYSTAIDDLVNKAVNRQPFQYDPATDAAYQSYARQYMRLGNEAAKDTLADVSAQTGGLPSSYAVTAAQQARNQYNQALTDKIPSLMEAAYAKYRDDYNDTLAGLSTLQGIDDSMYNRFATDRDFNEDVRRYGIDDAFRNRQQDFNESSWKSEFDEGVRQYEQNFGYQKERDAVADEQWNKEFDEKVREYDQNYGLDKNAQTFEQMLNIWTTLGYATKEVAKFFGVKEGTKTNEAAYQAAQLALAKSGRSGRSGGRSGRRSYGRGSSGYQSSEDKYGPFVVAKNGKKETSASGLELDLYKDSPYNVALDVASRKLLNGATEEQVVNYLNTVKGLSDKDIDRLKQALGLGGNKKDYHTYKDPYTGTVNTYNF